MRINNINNTTFGIKWNKSKVGTKDISVIKLDNNKTLAISTTYNGSIHLEKMYMLFNNAGDIIKVRFKTFFKKNKCSSLNIDNKGSIERFLG